MGYERVQPVTGGETAISRLFPHPARFAGVLGARDFNIHGPNWTIALPALILWFSLPRDRQQQFRSGTHANFYQREGLILGNSPVPQRRGIIKRRSFLSTAFSTARTGALLAFFVVASSLPALRSALTRISWQRFSASKFSACLAYTSRASALFRISLTSSISCAASISAQSRERW